MGNNAMSKIVTASVNGIDTEIVTVETDISVGLPNFSLVGLPGSAVRESKERVRAAIVNSGYEFPLRRITVNLSPADTRKDGSHFDLPIAVGVLAGAARDVRMDAVLEATAFFGELSLDGSVHRTELAAAMTLGLQDGGVRNIFLPEDNLPDVTELPGLIFYPVQKLSEVIEHLLGKQSAHAVKGGPQNMAQNQNDAITPTNSRSFSHSSLFTSAAGHDINDDLLMEDFFDVKGQEAVKRAFLISAAGYHDLVVIGPPGIGKSMMARRLPGILPPLSETESREVTRIHNIAGEKQTGRGLITQRPFRAPHHSSTQNAIVGGGHRPVPGELSLAHRGILFLDELPEFERRTLDMLRQPLEDRYIDLSRVGFKGRYPCDFLLIAAMNPCPCGYFNDPSHICTCTQTQRMRYLAKVSGPLLDRIDIHVRMGAVDEAEFHAIQADSDRRHCMCSDEMRVLIQKAADMQWERSKPAPCLYNGRMNAKAIERTSPLNGDAEKLLQQAYTHFALSVRARMKIIRVSRTIADLDGSDAILDTHIAEALAYRFPHESQGVVG
jgi:magnesium chelatase family protein